MTNYENAESLRTEYIANYKANREKINICTARKNWNGCDYADVYAGAGLECWKQGCKHNCIRCMEVIGGWDTAIEEQKGSVYHEI